jgi:hypothetical protein
MELPSGERAVMGVYVRTKHLSMPWWLWLFVGPMMLMGVMLWYTIKLLIVLTPLLLKWTVIVYIWLLAGVVWMIRGFARAFSSR